MIHIDELFDLHSDLVLHCSGNDYFYVMEFNEVAARQLFPVWQNLKPSLYSKKVKLIKPLILHRFKLSDCDYTTRRLIEHGAYYTFTTQMKAMQVSDVIKKKLTVGAVVLHRAVQHGEQHPICVMLVHINKNEEEVIAVVPELFFAILLTRQSVFEKELSELKYRRASNTIEIIPNAFWVHILMVDKDKPTDEFIDSHKQLIIHEELDHWMRFIVFLDPDNVLTASNDAGRFYDLVNSFKVGIMPKVVKQITDRYLSDSMRELNDGYESELKRLTSD